MFSPGVDISQGLRVLLCHIGCGTVRLSVMVAHYWLVEQVFIIWRCTHWQCLPYPLAMSANVGHCMELFACLLACPVAAVNGALCFVTHCSFDHYNRRQIISRLARRSTRVSVALMVVTLLWHSPAGQWLWYVYLLSMRVSIQGGVLLLVKQRKMGRDFSNCLINV
jgi:hypothetical protein